MISIRKKIEGRAAVALGDSAGKSVLSDVKITPYRSGFLHFSRKIDYGLLFMTELAKSALGEPLSLRSIAQTHGVSFFFLQKIALDLRKAGLIESGRGKMGGYSLAKPAEQITVQEMVEALEGPLAIMPCFNHESGETCAREKQCQIRSGLDLINQIIIDTFAHTTLSALLKKS